MIQAKKIAKTNFCLTFLLGSLVLLSIETVQAKDSKPLESTPLQSKPLAETQAATIKSKMDDFHDAADKGDKERYLQHFTKDAVFMGTDDWERWPYETFAAYVNQRFKDGEGWSYKPIKRYTNFSDQYDIAWVDEIVESEKWGRFRGTAVLQNTNQGWKIKHYSLTMLVPNESWPKVSEVTKQAFDKRTVEAGKEPPSTE